ncbi:creatininase family protein [Candidatus Bathyarchaeota archaeon]|nr:creatininase family protein [Candidatus Bathyarchaeota archaeon]
MTGHDFRLGRFDKAVLAVGSTEYHGEHLPYGTDTLVAEHLAEAVAERVEGLLVLPPLPLGMSHHYASFPLALSLSTETLMRVLWEVFESLLRHGIRRLLIINGHDGNIPAIEAATREFRVKHPEMKIAVLEAWWKTAADLLPEGTFEAWGGLGHGGEGETSMMMAVAPELVEMSHARGAIPKLPAHVEVKWRFEELTPYGVTGDPTKATAEKGRKMRDALVELLVSFLREMDQRGWELGFKAGEGDHLSGVETGGEG